MNRVASVSLVALVGVLGSACSSGDGSETGSDASRVATTVATSSTSTTSAPATSITTIATSTTSTASTSTTTSTTTTTVVEYPSAAGELGLATIEQLTALDGGGRRPSLAWEPVEGAVEYYVFVLSPSGEVYWGWETSDTSVPVGGTPQLDEVAPGPAISEGMTWSVSAIGVEGQIIALSAHRPIGP